VRTLKRKLSFFSAKILLYSIEAAKPPGLAEDVVLEIGPRGQLGLLHQFFSSLFLLDIPRWSF